MCTIEAPYWVTLPEASFTVSLRAASRNSSGVVGGWSMPASLSFCSLVSSTSVRPAIGTAMI